MKFAKYAIILAASASLAGCITPERARNYGALAIAIGNVIPTKYDEQIARVSPRLAKACEGLQVAVVGVDIFAPEKWRAAVTYGEAILTTTCAVKPKSAAEIGIAVARVLEAIALIEEAKKGAV